MGDSSTTTPSSSQPWIEKYRPTELDQIVLDPLNRRLLRNVVSYGAFPNLLLHGPGGAGKTTTAMALIREWFRSVAPDRSDVEVALMRQNVVILNASDDRGIEVIRSQVKQFSRSTPWHIQGTGPVQGTGPADRHEYKFVILDEVDAMTRQAQSALKTVMRTCVPRVRFCLLCNYMSRIDESLRTEFVCVRFSQMPPREVEAFVRRVADAEGVAVTDADVATIRRRYGSDIRSMVNHLQVRQQAASVAASLFRAPTAEDWNALRDLFRAPGEAAATATAVHSWIRRATMAHNLDPMSLFEQYFMYLLDAHPAEATAPDFLERMKRVVHSSPESNLDIVTAYFVESVIGCGKGTVEGTVEGTM